MGTLRSRLPGERRGVRLPAVVWGFLVLASLPVFADLLIRLWRGAAYDLAVIAPLLAGYLAWQRRRALRSTAWVGSPWGLAVVGLGLLMYAAGMEFGITTLVRASLVTAVAGAVYFQGGAPMLRLLALPLALLVFVVPPRTVFYGSLARGLQALTAVVVGEVLSRFGLLVERRGIFLVLPRATLEVTAGCSGIRSLAALSALALAIVASVPLSRTARWLFLAGTPVLAVLFNLARVMLIGFAAALTPIPAGLAHAVSNWIAFGASVATLVFVARRAARGATPVL